MMLKLLYLIFLGFCFLGTSPLVLAQSSLIELNSLSSPDYVGQKVYVFEDASAHLKIEDILKPEIQSKFKLIGKDVYTHPPTRAKFWLKLNIHNLSQEKAFIELGFHDLKDIHLYLKDKKSYKLAAKAGWANPTLNPNYPYNLYWLPLNSDSTIQTVYISILTEGLVEVPIKVGTALALSQSKAKNDYMVGGFVGLMLAMFIYNVFLLLSTGDKIYIAYLGYVFFSVFSASFLNNYPLFYLFFPDFIVKWLTIKVYIWLGIPLVCLGFFAIQFLHLVQYPPIFRRSIYLHIIIFGLLLPLINLFNLIPFHSQVVLYQVLTLTYAFCAVCTIIYAFSIRGKNIYYYTIGWTWAILGVLVYILSINGLIPFGLLTRNAIFIGVGLETCLFSIALGERYRLLRKEKNTIQAENLKLIQEQNKILEERIIERTTDIKRNEDLLEQTAQLARVGAWEIEWRTAKITWSKVTRLIHEVPNDYEPSIEKNRPFYSLNDGLERFYQVAFECAKSGKPIDIEMLIITAKGREIWVRVLGDAEFKDEKCVRLFGTFQDIDERKRAELETKSLQEKISSIFNSITEAVWSIRLSDRKPILITPSTEALFEIPSQDLMQNYQLWQTVVHPEDRELIEVIENALLNKKSYYFEYRIITKSGKLKWLGQRGRLIFDEEGKAIRVDGIISDITTRKLAEIENKKAQAKLASIFDSISEVVWSVSLPDYKMLMMTPSAVDLYEISYEDFMADSSYWEKAIHPEDKAVIPKIYQQLNDYGHYYEEYRIVTLSGIIKWISNHGQVIYDENKKPIRLDGLISDISQRKKAEEARAEEHALLRVIIDNIPVNIYVKDLKARKVMANRAELEYLGITSEAEIIGKNDFEFYPKELAEVAQEEDKQVMEAGIAILDKEVINIRTDGSERWILISKIPIYNAKGEINGLVGISYDFTSRKQAEESLKKLVIELKETKDILEQQTEEISSLNNQIN
jgi:PAS domain S-box-containing protein